MSKFIKILFSVILLISCSLVNNLTAQELLKIEVAVSIGLKNNFDIQISRNEAEINRENNTAGNAGMYPGINLNMGVTTGTNNTHLVYSTGNTVNNPSASVKTYNAGLALNWTVFDGFKMFTTKQKLNEIEKIGDLKYKQQVQQSVSQIIEAYYDIVKQKQQLNTIVEIEALSRERMTLGETRFNAGLSAKNEYLQAQIDYNTQKQSEVLQQNTIAESKRKLNQLLNREITTSFAVSDSIPFSVIDSSSALSKIISGSPGIQVLKKQLEIAKLSQNEIESLNYPYINFAAGYGYNLTENSTGLVNTNRAYGPLFGASLSYPIFQGGNISRQVQVAELAYNSASLQLESLKTQILAQFQSAFSQYKTNLYLLEIEEQTKVLAKENLFLAMERLKLSQTTSIEVRDAQLSYENSLTRSSNIFYNLKIAETQIRMLAGGL